MQTKHILIENGKIEHKDGKFKLDKKEDYDVVFFTYNYKNKALYKITKHLKKDNTLAPEEIMLQEIIPLLDKEVTK